MDDQLIKVLRNLKVGETLVLRGSEFTVKNIEDGSEAGKRFGLSIKRSVPVYYFQGMCPGAQGGYQYDSDVIFIFENNTDSTTLEHELIHAVEWRHEPTPGLLALFDKAKQIISEESFDDGIWFWGFKKDIHEFIAQGKTILASALKKEGLWDDFQRETAYIFQV